MNPKEFLSRWKADHINSGTQQTGTPALVETMLADAAEEGMDRTVLETAAGRSLEHYLVDAIREAVEQELW